MIRCYEDLACILVQGGLIFGCTCSVKMGRFSLLRGHFWIQEKNFMIFLAQLYYKDEVKEFSS